MPRTSSAIEPLLTAREVAGLFSLSAHSILDMSQDGRLPSFKLGHAVRFRRSDLERYLEGCYRPVSGTSQTIKADETYCGKSS